VRRRPSHVVCGLLQAQNWRPAGNACAASEEESRWFGRIGILGALYDSHARIAASGNVIPHATANVSNDVTVIFDVGYEITKNLSVLLMAGVPPKRP